MSLWPLIAFHVCAGSVGLLSGFVTMSFRKGSRRHRLAGDVFVIHAVHVGQWGHCWALSNTI